MKRLATLLVVGAGIFWAAGAAAQGNCPAGYEERNVMCNGKMVTKCIAVNYSCSQCWAVSFAPCPGTKSGGLNFYSSYEKASVAAQKESNNWHDGKCMFYDNRNYRIYLDDAKSCDAVPSGKLALKNDLLSKVKPFMQRYADEIINYRAYFNKQPYMPGAVFKEYATMLNQAEQNVRNLENMVNTMNDNNLYQVEKYFNDLQREEQRLMQADANFRHNLTTAKQEETNKQQAAAQQQLAAVAKQRQVDAQQREADLRQWQEAERERLLAIEQARQAQLVANSVKYEQSIATNNAETQAKLAEQRASSTLRDIPAYNRNSAQSTVARTSTSNLGKQAFGENGGGYLDGVDDAPPKKTTANTDDAEQDGEATGTAGKAVSPAAPATYAECDATFDVIEAQRLPPVVSVAAIGTSCEADIKRRILDFRKQDAPSAQLYIDQYCTAIRESAFDKLLIEWHQVQNKRGRMLEQELTDCLYGLAKQYSMQFNNAMTGANACLDRLRKNSVYYQHNRTVVENLQDRINSLRQQMQLSLSPVNPDPNNGRNALRSMSDLGTDICKLTSSIKP